MNALISSPDVCRAEPGALGNPGGHAGLPGSPGAQRPTTSAVARYNVHREHDGRLRTERREPDRAADRDDATSTPASLPASTTTGSLAEDAAGNVGPASNQASGTATADTTPPTAPSGLAAAAGPGGLASRGASRMNGGVARSVYRGSTANLVPSADNRSAQPTGSRNVDPGRVSGTTTAASPARIPPETRARPRRGDRLVPPDQRPGSSASGDSTPVSGRRRRIVRERKHRHDLGRDLDAAGKIGNALEFDGVNDLVTVADANRLDLTTGMTLEAWVRPTALGNDWRTAISRSGPAGWPMRSTPPVPTPRRCRPARSSSAASASPAPRRRWLRTRGHTSRGPTTGRPSPCTSTAPRPRRP